MKFGVRGFSADVMNVVLDMDIVHVFMVPWIDRVEGVLVVMPIDVGLMNLALKDIMPTIG